MRKLELIILFFFFNRSTNSKHDSKNECSTCRISISFLEMQKQTFRQLVCLCLCCVTYPHMEPHFCNRGIPGFYRDKYFFPSLSPFPFFCFMGTEGWTSEIFFLRSAVYWFITRGRETPSHCFLVTGKWLPGLPYSQSMSEWVCPCEAVTRTYIGI